MKTAAEIMEYLQLAMKEAFELHDEAKGKDAEAAYFHLLVATTIQHIIEEIEN